MAEWTEERRHEAEAEGHTFSGDRYPIESCADVENAARLVGQSPPSERPAIRQYIARRAMELGCPLPKGWEVHHGHRS